MNGVVFAVAGGGASGTPQATAGAASTTVQAGGPLRARRDDRQGTVDQRHGDHVAGLRCRAVRRRRPGLRRHLRRHASTRSGCRWNANRLQSAVVSSAAHSRRQSAVGSRSRQASAVVDSIGSQGRQSQSVVGSGVWTYEEVAFITALALGCGIGWGTGRGVGIALPGEASLRAQASNASQLVDWLTDGGDNQRTGWAKNEKILTKQNVGNLKLLWTLETGNQPRALHSLMPVLVDQSACDRQRHTTGRHRQRHLRQPLRLRRRDRQDSLAEALDVRPARWPRRRRRRRMLRRIRGSSGSSSLAAAATRRSSAPLTRRAGALSISSRATGCCTS